MMDMLFGLVSLVGLSLFLARALGRSSAVMPLVSCAAAMLWFTVFGCLGLLRVGGYVWYALCALALGFVLWREKGKTIRLFTPGLWFFLAGSVLFLVLFFFTKPLLTQWDEFTFWGTAAKATTNANQLYTTAHSNLIARSYPPGLIVFSYMLQFFGGAFAEYKLITAFAVLYLACFAAPSALRRDSRAGAMVLLAGMALLPFCFELATPPGQMSWSYLSCMADAPLAALFGGALCLYFAGGEKDEKLLLPFGVVLAALANVKDIGLALALIALFVAALDMLLCERGRLRFFKLKGLWAWLAGCASCAALAAGAYLGWAAHLDSLPESIDRFDLGGSGVSLRMPDMLLAGVKALFGIEPNEHFTFILNEMKDAFFHRPISVVGAGVVVLALLLALSVIVYLLAGTKKQRRRVLVFTLGMAACFVAFYIFNVFTYTFIFKGGESTGLKDYHRYIYPYWFGWAMGALSLLAMVAGSEKLAPKRKRPARIAALLCTVALAAGFAARAPWGANFAHISPSLYGTRRDIAAVTGAAREEGMGPEDVVYIISQGDDATRFYQFGFDMEATRVPLYGVPQGKSAAALVPPGDTSGYDYKVACTPRDLVRYLRETGCTHILVDVPDEYILDTFGPLFEDGLAGWELAGMPKRGHVYYRIAYTGNTCRFVYDEGEVATP